jgi:hypothetical protein
MLSAALLMLASAPAAGQASSTTGKGEPLPRFQDPICPGVIGLKVEVAEAVVGRIRQNAEQIGLPLADERSCDPNVIATFIADGKAYLSRLAKEDSWMFRDLTAEERKALLEQPGKVRAWTRTVVRTRDGHIVSRRDNLMDIPQATMSARCDRVDGLVRSQRHQRALGISAGRLRHDARFGRGTAQGHRAARRHDPDSVRSSRGARVRTDPP